MYIIFHYKKSTHIWISPNASRLCSISIIIFLFSFQALRLSSSMIWPYTSVTMSACACPESPWTTLMSPPLSFSLYVTLVCRRLWKTTSGSPCSSITFCIWSRRWLSPIGEPRKKPDTAFQYLVFYCRFLITYSPIEANRWLINSNAWIAFSKLCRLDV